MSTAISCTSQNNTPRIYVACLAAYNSGILHGAWIDANQDPDDLQAAINDMLAKSPEPFAEEYAIHDYDCFGSMRIEEYQSLGTVSELAELIMEHGELFAEVYSHFGDIAQAKECFEENYQGAWDRLENWAANFLEETGQIQEIPQNLQYYFDYEAFARDCELNGDIFSIQFDGDFHVFWSR